MIIKINNNNNTKSKKNNTCYIRMASKMKGKSIKNHLHTRKENNNRKQNKIKKSRKKVEKCSLTIRYGGLYL
jgi:hypothetical protein